VLTGLPVEAIKVPVVMSCPRCAGILEAGRLGTVAASLGQGMALMVLGAVLIEVSRNGRRRSRGADE
jgi:ribose/xylose/arabinose/galactoside ABC-type transport system permease subunit